VRPLLGLLEDEPATARLLSAVSVPGGVIVRIGRENAVDGLERVSVVAAAFGSGEVRGVVCVIGPTRMDYPRAMAAVDGAARSLTGTLGH
jgi:heat-inducible transcriptional repressor